LEGSAKDRNKIALFNICLHMCSTITVFFLSVLRRRNLSRIFVLISEVDDLMYGNTERAVLYKRTRSFVVLELLITSVAVGIVLYVYSLKLPEGSVLEHVSILLETVEHMPLICLILEFPNVVLLLRQRYKCLNRMLDSHSHVWNDRTISIGRNILSLLDTDTFGSSYCNKTSFSRQILQKRHIYSKLYDIVLLVNSCFGLPICVLTCCIFVSAVLVSYLCAASIMLVKSKET
jgi:hypothetical protein